MSTPAPKATIVVAPREKFSCAVRSLDSVYAHTEGPFELVYVDGGSPPLVRRQIEERARHHGFELIRRDHYLPPNLARNLGLARVRTPYVAFLDNDVVVTPGWLQTLIDCAEETGAAIVGPLVCQGEPLHEIVHCAGGDCGVRERQRANGPERVMHERIFHQGKRAAALGLVRTETNHAEFHCMLVERAFLDQIGGLDEGIFNTREHVDLCISAAHAGRKIVLEPASVVTYLHDAPLEWRDMGFYMLRWGDVWERRSLAHLQQKYDLTTDQAMAMRLQAIGWRRRMYLIRPLVKSLTGTYGNRIWPRLVEKVLATIDRPLNQFIYLYHRLRAS